MSPMKVPQHLKKVAEPRSAGLSSARSYCGEIVPVRAPSVPLPATQLFCHVNIWPLASASNPVPLLWATLVFGFRHNARPSHRDDFEEGFWRVRRSNLGH
jgi:hypothetical protein